MFFRGIERDQRFKIVIKKTKFLNKFSKKFRKIDERILRSSKNIITSK